MFNTGFWNRLRYTLYSPIYDMIVGGSFKEQRKKSIELLELKPGARVLVVGAGTGLDLPYFPSDVEITAIDITPGMIERLKKKAQKLDMKVDAQVMDARVLDFPGDSFDCVVLHLILAVMPDPELCMVEVERVLRLKGRAVVFDKFLPDSARPSMPRKVLNVFTRVAFSDINRRLGYMISLTELKLVHLENSSLGGFFRIAMLQKQS